MSDQILRTLERNALQGDFNSAIKLELSIARLKGRCPCEGGCPSEEWETGAYWEVFRDFDEHGGYRGRL